MDHERALFANEAFYMTFSRGDAEAMERLWAYRSPLSCIHPGWTPLTDREAIVESWARILANPNAPDVTPHYARALDHGSMTRVLCYERLGETMLVATNIFVEEEATLRLVHHQASQCANPPTPEAGRRREVQ